MAKSGAAPAELASKSAAPTLPMSATTTYFWLTWFGFLIHVLFFLWQAGVVHPATIVFVVPAAAVYAALYVIPVVAITWLGRTIVRAILASVCPRPKLQAWLYAALAILPAATVHFFLHLDRFVFRLYGFHLNGFVWNLVFTRGGLDSLGGGSDTTIRFALFALLFLVLQLCLLMVALRLQGNAPPIAGPAVGRGKSRRRACAAIALFLLLAGVAQGMYAWARIKGNPSILSASGAVPLFIPVSFTRLAGMLGANIDRDVSIAVENATQLRLDYPLRHIKRRPIERPPNIVWLVAESLRADMLDPEIMPATWALARQSSHFLNHYSGGNGTRMGMFSMFYGLYGTYWFSFLADRRGPVMIDVLLDMNYQMELYTSATFTYPEFDKTIFARVDSKKMHEIHAEPRWRRDLHQVASILDFIEKRDPARPFMTFMFFESPHARYYFPAEAAIRKPYAENFDYATMDVANDMPLIKNRYINACHFLDSQIARILRLLAERSLMDNTIILITGDHGEEFMEKGRWGHNSAFTEEQTRVPLVLWVPGRPPREISRMTSHLDLPATIMPMLGVENPAEDYSLGLDLMDDTIRTFTVLSDWNELAIFTGDMKAEFQIGGYGFVPPVFATQDDSPLPDNRAFDAKHRQTMLRVMAELKKFSK